MSYFPTLRSQRIKKQQENGLRQQVDSIMQRVSVGHLRDAERICSLSTTPIQSKMSKQIQDWLLIMRGRGCRPDRSNV